MRVKFILLCMFILGAWSAFSASGTMNGQLSSEGQPGGLSGGRAASLDVLGSSVNNTTIIIPDGSGVEVNILGSSTSNIQIGSQKQERNEDKKCDGCGPCGEEKCYSTPWDDFNRPLCYPWSSYIPTRYNRPFTRAQSGHLGSVSG